MQKDQAAPSDNTNPVNNNKTSSKVSGLLKLKSAVNKIKLNQDSTTEINISRNNQNYKVKSKESSDKFANLVNNIKLLNIQNKAVKRNEELLKTDEQMNSMGLSGYQKT
jgi:hypothetical protein